jgi:vesicle-associated membrane protein 72
MVTSFFFEYFVAYCVVAKESAPNNVSAAFLERLKDDFMKRYGGGKADTALAKSLNKEYGYA